MFDQSKFLSDSEVAALIAILKRRSRDELLIELALATGARRCELLALEVSNLSPRDNTVFIKGSKGSNDRTIEVKAGLVQAILALPRESKKLFDIKASRLWYIWDTFRPVPKKFHSLRHTFAVRLYERTKDIRLVQRKLGHKSVTNTEIYAAVVNDASKMREVANGLY